MRRHVLRTLFAAHFCFAFLGLFLNFSLAQQKDVEEYRLGAGDEIRLKVFGHRDLSGDFAVDGAGRLSLPLVGGLLVRGLSANEIEQAISARLKPDYLKNPHISVEITKYRPYYIMGEVKRPGSYPFVHGMTVLNAIALAGGYTRRAREDKLLVIRWADPSNAKRPANQSTQVFPGDILEVTERFF